MKAADFLIICTLLALNASVAQADVNDSPLCTVALSATNGKTPGSSSGSTLLFENLLRSLLKRGALNEEQINLILNAESPQNPAYLANKTISETEKYVIRLAFDKIFKSTDKIDREKVRKSLALEENERLQERVRRTEAQETSRAVVTPVMVYSLPKKYGGTEGRALFSLAALHDRKVILGREPPHDYIYDPSSKTIVDLSAKLGGGGRLSADCYFQYKGGDYLYRSDFYKVIYNLKTKRNEASKFSNIDIPLDYGQHAAKIISDAEGIRAMRLFKRYGDPVIKLIESYITEPGKEPQVLASFDGYGMEDFGLDYVGDHPIISYLHSGQNKVFFYDAKTKKAFPEISADLFGMGDSYSYAAVYGDQQHLRAIFPVIGKYAVADLESGRILEYLDLLPQGHRRIRVTTADNNLVAYTALDSAVGIIDLKSRRVESIPIDAISSDVAEFDFRGEKFLTWATWEGDVEIYNLSRHTKVASSRVLSRKDGVSPRIHQVLPFEQGDRVFAMISPWDEPPAIIQLAGPLDEKSAGDK